MKAGPTLELYKASAKTFEELAFLLVREGSSEEPPSDSACSVVDVGFQGPFEGRLVVRFCGGLGEALASNMLGLDPPIPGELREDALKEVSNVICGNFLPAVSGKDAVFRIDAPRLLPAGVRPDPKGYALESEVSIALETGGAQVSFYRRL